jgi:hypothetical protein
MTPAEECQGTTERGPKTENRKKIRRSENQKLGSKEADKLVSA